MGKQDFALCSSFPKRTTSADDVKSAKQSQVIDALLSCERGLKKAESLPLHRKNVTTKLLVS